MKRHFPLFMLILLLLPLVVLAQEGSPPDPEAVRPIPLEPERVPYLETEPAGDPAPQRAAPASPSTLPHVVSYGYQRGNWNLYGGPGDGLPMDQMTADAGIEIYPDVNRGLELVVYSGAATGSADFDLFLLPGSDSVPFLRLPGDQIHATWSPDGRQIAFQSVAGTNSDIYLVNADGSGLQGLTSYAGYDGMPAWGPDGRWLVFSSNRSGALRLWRMDADGGNVRQLNDVPSSVYPAVSPDGRRIAFSADSNLDGWLELWSMSSDGTEPTLLHPRQANTDLIVRDWKFSYTSQSAQEITLTQVNYIEYQGKWYWTQAGIYQKEEENVYGMGYLGYIPDNGYAWGPSWAPPEGQPPRFSLPALDSLLPPGLTLTWTDDRTLQEFVWYEVQRRQPGGAWEPWQEMAEPALALELPPGQPYEVRLRARDQYYNWSEWQQLGDGPLTLYHWSLQGQVTDNAGVPLAGAMAQAEPAAFLGNATDERGKFSLYVGPDAAGYKVTWQQRSQYGPLPATTYAGSSLVETARVVLPPLDDGIINGSLEADLASAWQVEGAAGRSKETRNSGEYGAHLGVSAFPAPPLEWEEVANSLVNLPKLVVDNEGTAHIVVMSPDLALLYYGRPSLGEWSEPVEVANPGEWVSITDLEADEAGGLHLLWLGGMEDQQQPKTLHYSYRPAGGAWQTPQKIAEEVPGREVELVLAAGEVHVAYSVGFQPTRLFYRSRPLDGPWSVPLQLDQRESGYAITLRADDQGTVHLLWNLYNWDDIFEANYYQKPAGGAWSAAETLPAAGSEMVLAVGPQGQVHFLNWADRDALWHRQRTGPGKWSAPYRVSEPGGWQVKAAVAADGTLYVVRSLPFPEEESRLEIRVRPAGGPWLAPITLPAPGSHLFLAELLVSGPAASLFYLETSGPGRLLYYLPLSPSLPASPVVLAGWADVDNLSVELAVRRHQETFHLAVLTNEEWPHHLRHTTFSFTPQPGALSQRVTIPAAGHPRLSFLYRLHGAAEGNQFEVWLGEEVLARFDGAQPAWTHASLDLAAWAGQSLTLTLRAEAGSSTVPLLVSLDDVSLGSSYPDLLLEGQMPRSARPGEPLTVYVWPLNQSPVTATAQVQLTLPAGLEWVAASPAPGGSSPYTWDLDSLALAGEPAITITLRVKPGTATGQTLRPSLAISGPPERETANNLWQPSLFIGHQIFLPLAGRSQ